MGVLVPNRTALWPGSTLTPSLAAVRRAKWQYQGLRATGDVIPARDPGARSPRAPRHGIGGFAVVRRRYVAKKYIEHFENHGRACRSAPGEGALCVGIVGRILLSNDIDCVAREAAAETPPAAGH